MVAANVNQVSPLSQNGFCFPLCLLPARLRLLEKLQVQFPHRRELHLRGRPPEKLGAQFFFQLGDLPADRLPGHKQFLRRPGKAPKPSRAEQALDGNLTGHGPTRLSPSRDRMHALAARPLFLQHNPSLGQSQLEPRRRRAHSLDCKQFSKEACV